MTWLITKKFLVGTVAVIFDHEDKVLLFKHTYRTKYPWGLPSGWLKTDESPMKAIEREVFEESGYGIRAIRPLAISGDDEYPRVDLIFLCELTGGSFRPSAEVSETRFFALDALPQCLLPHQRDVIYQAIELLGKNTDGQQCLI